MLQEDVDQLKEWAVTLERERIRNLPALEDFKRRVENGCRMCGTMNKSDSLGLQGISDPDNEDEYIPFVNHTTGIVLSTAFFYLCRSCLGIVVNHLRESSPAIYHGLHDDWWEKVLRPYQEEIARLEQEIERQKGLRRERDARRKTERKKRDRAKGPSTVTELAKSKDWGMLRVLFSEDRVGLKLIALACQKSTPPHERKAAINKLVNRRIRWQHTPTTSVETRSTRPATRSARSLASSSGG